MSSVQIDKFGRLPDGREVHQFVLTNASGLTVAITDYGATVTRILCPDAKGNMADVVLGFENLESYLDEHPYFGATVGRFANRIARANFTLDGADYHLAANNAGNSLHGGIEGFSRKLWTVEETSSGEEPSMKLSYLSPHMEEGFPGNLGITINFRVLCENALSIEFTATTDRATPINLTNHSYFNLAGAGSGTVLGHELMVMADAYTPVDGDTIPTGEIAPVSGTPFDLRTLQCLGDKIGKTNLEDGYDHNFVIRSSAERLKLAALLKDPDSGRCLEVFTTKPGIQVYTSNFLDGTCTGIGGIYHKHYGICLETQFYPDSVHHANFPDSILRPNETYEQTTVFKFSCDSV